MESKKTTWMDLVNLLGAGDDQQVWLKLKDMIQEHLSDFDDESLSCYAEDVDWMVRDIQSTIFDMAADADWRIQEMEELEEMEENQSGPLGLDLLS